MCQQEEGVTHTATPLGKTGRKISQTSEEALLAVGRSRTNELRETHLREWKKLFHNLESLKSWKVSA